MQIRYQRLHRMNPLEARRIIIETYERYASISATAREMETSRQVVRKWVQRYELEGEKGLRDRSRRPHISPRKTPSKIERLVRKLRSKTGCGRRRLAWILRRDYNICISEDTVRHILRRLGTKSKRKPRRRFYPAHWVWEVKEPFFHPTRTEVRAGTPIFCPKDKRRVKRSSICPVYSAGRILTTSYVWLRPGSMSTTSKGLTSVRAWVDCRPLHP